MYLPFSEKREHSLLSCSLQGDTETVYFSLKNRLNTQFRILENITSVHQLVKDIS